MYRSILDGYNHGGERYQLGKSALNLVRAALNKILNHAVEDDGLIPVNPARGITLPKPALNGNGTADGTDDAGEDSTDKAFSKSEREALVATVADHWIQMPVAIGLGTGLRGGEIMALRVQDVVLSPEGGGRVRVRHTVDRTTVTLVPPKTKASRRAVYIQGALVDLLAAFLETRRSEGAALGLPLGDDHLLFPLDPCHPTTPRHPRTFGQIFERQAKRAGISPGNFHRCRHTHAVQLLVDARVPHPVVAKRLGHADPSITLSTYSGAIEEMQKAAAGAAGSLFDDLYSSASVADSEIATETPVMTATESSASD